jgi:MFS family permease
VGSILLFTAFLALYYNRGSAMSALEDIILMGFGLSFIFVGVINILIVSSPASEAGVSTGMNVVFRNIGSAIASAIAGVYMTLYSVNVPVSLTKTVSIPTSEAYDHVYLIGMLFLVISLVFTLLMKNAVMVPDKSGIKEKSPLPGNSGSK